MSKHAAETRYVVEPDRDPDLSWLDEDEYRLYPVTIDGRLIEAEEYCDPANHETWVVLTQERCSECEEWRTVDALGGIDVWAPTSSVTSGVYETLPKELSFAFEPMTEDAPEGGE